MVSDIKVEAFWKFSLKILLQFFTLPVLKKKW